MKRHIWTTLTVATLALSMSAGCSWTQRGAAVGGGIGAGTGAIWAANAGQLSTAEGALVGLAAGGLAGALVGDLLDQKHARDLEKQIKELEEELAAKKSAEDKNKERLAALQKKLKDLQSQLKERDKEIADLRKKLGELEGIKVSREGDAIVLTILGETLYASGKAELKPEGQKTLDRVIKIVRDQFPDREILVRGHTDNEPIKQSGWKSNWELGAARSLVVLHYLMDKGGFKGENISASTYAFYRPVTDNATAAGRQQNRRAEIVIMPKREVKLERVK